MASYPVVFDIPQQERYNRLHIAIRIVALIVLSMLGGALGWIGGLVYLGVPLVAAILIAQKGASRYFAEAEQDMAKWLRWIAGLYAYLVLLTDRLPNEDVKQTMTLEFTPTGEPSAGNVLLRIILAIPHAIVLGLLGIVAGVLALVAAVFVLVQETYPQGIFSFLRGYMRWNVRLYAYMAGFAQDYPPFALDMGEESGATPPMPPVPASDGGTSAGA